MLDDATTGPSTPAPRCNWCSAGLPSDHEATCPSCGATLLGDGDPSVPGLTAIDAEAILRSARAAKTKPRGRLLSWISGDYEEGDSTIAASPGSLGPPTGDVRREMLRLEIEAQLTNAQAEAEALAADAAVEEGLSLGPLADPIDDGADVVAESGDRAAAATTESDETPPT
ncbi:MAG TPA: hypothetical protein VM427_05205 [Patescibacteria group bacterium]|nr:hypothetical protein [Patescibacteria group bacterium]